MSDLEILIDFHRMGERQGPGSEGETLRALALTGIDKGSAIKVADIGCGTGSQTLSLAQHLTGEITAIDIFPGFLEELDRRAAQRGLREKIKTLSASMEELPFAEEDLDLIWSEGAIYNMGFEAGIKNWYKYLKPGGCLAVSEITWITHSRPEEIEAFWNTAYPEIDIASNKIKMLEDNGYILLGYFFLSQDSWSKNYYRPMEVRFMAFLEKHHHSLGAQKITTEYQDECKQYERFKEYYSYGFYVARKV